MVTDPDTNDLSAIVNAYDGALQPARTAFCYPSTPQAYPFPAVSTAPLICRLGRGVTARRCTRWARVLSALHALSTGCDSLVRYPKRKIGHLNDRGACICMRACVRACVRACLCGMCMCLRVCALDRCRYMAAHAATACAAPMCAFDRESIGPVVGEAVSAVAAARGREPQRAVQRLPSDHTGYSVPTDSAPSGCLCTCVQ